MFGKKTVCRGDTIRSCVVKEYKVKDYDLPQKDEGINGYGIQMFIQPPTSSDLTLNSAYKTVLTEYYLLDDYALIGTIGGTLGLMIGFSFMGFITSFVEFILSMKAQKQNCKTDGKAKKSRAKNRIQKRRKRTT